MTPCIFCGTFEAEAYWREPALAKLPSLRDPHSSRIVSAMDEMLFAFCHDGDTVITAHRMEDAHVDYLHTIGFKFKHNLFDLSAPGDGPDYDNYDIPPNVFQRMQDQRLAARLESTLTRGACLEPFAVLPGAVEVAERYGLIAAFPELAVVEAVNSKCYSIRMRDRLEIPNVGVIIEDVASLLNQGMKFLQTGSFLIKDDYGVSGKGNQHISGESALTRMAKYLSKQEAKGKKIRFVLEPYLEKVSDFSCQLHISRDGNAKIVAVQQLMNNGLAFGASHSAPLELTQRLDEVGYYRAMDSLAGLMRADGYFGDVCVDSMVLRDGTVAPLVEINARKSMSLIKHALDRVVARIGRKGRLTYIQTMSDRYSSFSELLNRLDEADVLFTPERSWGILPLTSRTMFPFQSTNDEPVRGRLYLFLIFERDEDQGGLLAVVEQAVGRARHLAN